MFLGHRVLNGVSLVHSWQGTVPREDSHKAVHHFLKYFLLQVTFSWNTIVIWSRLKSQKKCLSLEDKFPCGFQTPTSNSPVLPTPKVRNEDETQPSCLALERGLKAPLSTFIYGTCAKVLILFPTTLGGLNPPEMLATWGGTDCRVYTLQQWSWKKVCGLKF